ncbi:nucleotide sugar dehydrogenase [Sporosarcina sp. Marseille-Q4063]|uniref:nucleotide sugar dehydrogenase n=1 Tax=Sporosarcina sp. Marseille-Q4063 TaxID=2810514 RepID=UPI001BB06422|nr:nucleotide sugar dehydrogenase [Sporosarcina sp. Marseille-Q4063]QUW21253.1 nucleotide sugar dehydrogenase [Sporosarcina sp. Marseille-Q4063]
MKKLCVIGLGYIGLPTAAVFANNGWSVHGVDLNPTAVNSINNGEIHIEEVGLEELVSNAVKNGYLRASHKAELADCYIIAVPTPVNSNNTANLDYVKDACRSILPVIKKGDVVIVESTIPPRTIDDVVAPIFEGAGWNVYEDIYLAHCPERVLPGRIVIEVVENDRIVGGINEASAEAAAKVYDTFVTGAILKTSALSAEMSKLMENTYRDVNIALANELVKISEKLGVDALEVIKLANHHPRVNLHLPGPGVGGHCLAVDPYFIIEKAPSESVLISESRKINNSMPNFVIEQVEKIISNRNSKVAVLGLTYKGNIDDVRESPAMEIVSKLLDRGFSIGVHDPHIKQNQVDFKLSPFNEAIEDAECLLVLTDHNEFKVLDENEIVKKMKRPFVFDTRNCVKIQNSEIQYVNFGNLDSVRTEMKLKK